MTLCLRICPICEKPVAPEDGHAWYRVSNVSPDDPRYHLPYIEDYTHWGYCTDVAYQVQGIQVTRSEDLTDEVA